MRRYRSEDVKVKAGVTGNALLAVAGTAGAVTGLAMTAGIAAGNYAGFMSSSLPYSRRG